MVFPVVLCGCKTWSISIWEEHVLQVFKKRVLRKTRGTKRKKVTGCEIKLCNEKFHCFSSHRKLFFLPWRNSPTRAMAASFLRFLHHIRNVILFFHSLYGPCTIMACFKINFQASLSLAKKFN